MNGMFHVSFSRIRAKTLPLFPRPVITVSFFESPPFPPLFQTMHHGTITWVHPSSNWTLLRIICVPPFPLDDPFFSPPLTSFPFQPEGPGDVSLMMFFLGAYLLNPLHWDIFPSHIGSNLDFFFSSFPFFFSLVGRRQHRPIKKVYFWSGACG